MRVSSDFLLIALGVLAVNFAFVLLRQYGRRWRLYERATLVMRITFIPIWVGLGILFFIKSFWVGSLFCFLVSGWESNELRKQIAAMNRFRRRIRLATRRG